MHNQLTLRLKKKITNIKASDTDAYININNILGIVFKYRVLRQLRVEYLLGKNIHFNDSKYTITASIFNQLTKKQLNTLNAWDLAAKKFIYSQPITIFSDNSGEIIADEKKLSSILSPQAITILLQHETPTFIAILKKMKMSLYYSVIQHWKTTLSACINRKESTTNWKTWFTEKVLDITERLYTFSLVGLFGHLGTIIGDTVDCPRTGKWLGSGIGLSISYYFGCYAFMRSVLVGTLSMQMATKLHTQQIVDQSAIIKSLPYYFSPNHSAHACYLTEAIMESLYQGNLFPIIKSLLGSLASVSSLAALNCCYPEESFRAKSATSLAKLTFTRSVIALIALQLGRGIATLGENAYINFRINRAFLEYLTDNLGFTPLKNNLTIDPPNPLSINFWFSRNQSVSVTWRIASHSTLFKRQCYLTHNNSPSNYGSATCDELTVLPSALPMHLQP